jgi:hypothetical protein
LNASKYREERREIVAGHLRKKASENREEREERYSSNTLNIEKRDKRDTCRPSAQEYK